jgi:phage/plasmid-like protein (TIGR03299 family)
MRYSVAQELITTTEWSIKLSHGITETDSLFSVRQMPWHGLGAVLDEYPESIEDALQKAGLEWGVSKGDVLVVKTPERRYPCEVCEGSGKSLMYNAITCGECNGEGERIVPAEIVPATEFKANVREDTGDILGIVSNDYKIVPNKDAFKFMDSLIGSDLHFETAGSLQGGRKVWVLAKVPEYIEVGGDQVGNYLYVANSHDGSMAVTASVTPVRIVCANTLGAALRRSDVNAQRTFKFRHTGNLQNKFDEARKVMGITINYAEQFKVLGDRLAQQHMGAAQFDQKVVKPLLGLDKREDLGKRALTHRENAREVILGTFGGYGLAGDTTGNSPNTKWCAWNAIGEYADYGRRVTKRTNQMARSFEDVALKDKGLALVEAA